MPLLDLKVQEYKMLIDKKVNLEFESGFSFNIRFKTVNFPHLVGLHQYTDINVLKKLNEKRIPAKSIWKQLRNKKITMDKLSKSVHFQNPLISSRIKELDTYYLLGFILNDDSNYYPASFLVRQDTVFIGAHETTA